MSKPFSRVLNQFENSILFRLDHDDRRKMTCDDEGSAQAMKQNSSEEIATIYGVRLGWISFCFFALNRLRMGASYG